MLTHVLLEFSELTSFQTFVAMPLFDWQEHSLKHVPTQHYWLYWAITGPLTVTTLAIVISWSIWRSRKTRELIQQAREDSVSGSSSYMGSIGYEKSRASIEVDSVDSRESIRPPPQRFAMPNFMGEDRNPSFRPGSFRRKPVRQNTFNSRMA